MCDATATAADGDDNRGCKAGTHRSVWISLSMSCSDTSADMMHAGSFSARMQMQVGSGREDEWWCLGGSLCMVVAVPHEPAKPGKQGRTRGDGSSQVLVVDPSV